MGRMKRDARQARMAFLSDGPESERLPVRPAVRASWLRSANQAVDADRATPAFTEVDSDKRLVRIARPVLDGLEAKLINEPVAIFLTDAKGTIVDRRGGDDLLQRRLAEAHLAPGFDYSEGSMGTNGIGTALEVGGLAFIQGSEHFVGNLGAFACAGITIKHPIGGQVVGVLDITSLADVSSPLLAAFASLTAQQIQQAMLNEESAAQRELLNEYQAACQHTGGPVIALSREATIINEVAQNRFDQADQVALLNQIQESLDNPREHSLLADLPSGRSARLVYRPTFDQERVAGGIIRIQELTSPEARDIREHRVGRSLFSLAQCPGSSPAWQRAIRTLVDCAEKGLWVEVVGEPGSGKQTLVSAVATYVRGQAPVVLAAGTTNPDQLLEDLEAALLEGRAAYLRDIDRFPENRLCDLTALIQSVQDRDLPTQPWLAASVSPTSAEDRSLPGELMPYLTRTALVPPLRHHVEDIPAILNRMLGSLGYRDVRFSPEASRLLMRLTWPENLDGLREVVRAVTRTRRCGEILPEHLPPSCHSTSRRRLSQIEALERDAIVTALADHGGDKAAAASALGVSRATVYRKIRDYGIVT